MNLEGLTLKLVTDNLNQELLGSKIYRVYMPNAQTVLLLVRRSRDTSALVADMNGGSPCLFMGAEAYRRRGSPPLYGSIGRGSDYRRNQAAFPGTGK